MAPLTFGSVCSGIEAASVAWHPLGWRSTFFSEIEKFPCRVLKHHYPNVPNHGDMTKFKDWPDHAIDVLVGGTPCQSFSVAGLRKGLDDPRGNLMLTYLAIADRYRPKWLVWENVPGVLSSNGGRDFGTLLGGLAELGYGFAYRVLDAQHFGVPQRRRRVFVVGYLGDWRRAAAVLFERDSLQGHPAPGREARKDVTGTLSARTEGGGGLGTDFECQGGLVAPCFTGNPYGDHESREGHLIAAFDCKAGGNTGFAVGDTAGTLRGDGHGGGHAAVAFQQNQVGEIRTGDVIGTLNTNSNASGRNTPMVASSIRLANTSSNGWGIQEEVTHTLDQTSGPAVHCGSIVRRLTPRECERLQGFPDDYTAIPKAADGPRYKALGNSMAVPVMRWIGERIQMVEDLP